MTNLETLKEKLGKTYYDLEFLLNCLKEVLEEINESALISCIPWINDSEVYEDLNFTDKHFHLFSICFQFLNLAETNGAVQNRRKTEENSSLDSVNGLWAKSLSILKSMGIGEEAIFEKLREIIVQPVLTAHPTEAKRPVVLKHYRELYLLLVKRENSMYNSYEAEETKNDIKQVITKIWYIDEYYLEKPRVESELDNVLHYFVNVFPEVIPQVNRRLIQAWKFHGYDETRIIENNSFPVLRFGTWIGGDRDGHPLVTADVTKNTLYKLRLNAFMILKKELIKLADNLSFYIPVEDFSMNISGRLDELISESGSSSGQILSSFRNEAFKLYTMLMIEKLPIIIGKEQTFELIEKKGAYRQSLQLVSDLEELKYALIKYGMKFLADHEINNTIMIVRTFGFHLAELDIRQNSNYYRVAFLQIIRESKVYEQKDEISEEEFCSAIIKNELLINRPFTRNWENLPSEAVNVLDCFAVLNNFMNEFSHLAIGSLIVSMTHSAEDLLVVYLLARETGLTLFNETLILKLHVVPLFETIDDLIMSPEILDNYLANPVVKNSLEYQRILNKREYLIQEVMIGYSDSNKDGGILASAYYLNRAQRELVATGRKHGVKIRFFHGKGGSISRGAGPVHWFMRSLPHGTLSGQFKITEQGETIEKKYANQGNARYNLELLIAGNFMNTLLHEQLNQPNVAVDEILEFMAHESQNEYLKLLGNEQFMSFYQEATPIDVIELSNIGSRPARRTGKRSFSDLRAIPWVFSWGQIRFQLTSWYGVGTTLEKMRDMYPENFDLLKKLIPQNHFIRYLLTNIDSSLASTDEEIMEMYSFLVQDKSTQETILPILMNELNRTRRLMGELLGRSMAERRENHYYSTILRAEALKVIHRNQIRILSLWRNNQDESDYNKSHQLNQLLISVNAIANAMGATG